MRCVGNVLLHPAAADAMEWTTAAPLALAVLHLALAHDEDAVTGAAAALSLAVAAQALSAANCRAVSIALAAPTAIALVWGAANEALHAHSVAKHRPAAEAATAHWRAMQHRHNAHALAQLLAARAARRAAQFGDA